MKTIEFKDPSYKTASQQVCKPKETLSAPVTPSGNDNNSAEVIVMYAKENVETRNNIRNIIPLSVNDRFFKFNKFFCEGVLMDHVLLLYNCCS